MMVQELFLRAILIYNRVAPRQASEEVKHMKRTRSGLDFN